MTTIAGKIGALERQLELARQSGEFISLVRVLLQAKGDLWAARQIVAEHGRVSPRVKALLESDYALNIIRRGSGPQLRGSASDQFMSTKAAASALSLTDNAQFANYELLVSGFANALSSTGVFDQVRPSTRQVPVGRTVGAVSTAAVGYTISEAGAKAVSRLSLTNGTLTPEKSHCAIAISNELLKFGGREVDALLTAELIRACTLAVDSAFVTTLLAGVSVQTSTGSTALALRNDLANLLGLVTTDQTSKLFLITTPLVCKAWTALGASATSGAVAFEGMIPTGGGTILGIPVLASDAMATGTALLLDASGIATGSDTIVLSVIDQGTIMPSDAPDSPQVAGTNVVSLWQSDLSAILVERWHGTEKLRANCVSAVVNSGSWLSGFSP